MGEGRNSRRTSRQVMSQLFNYLTSHSACSSLRMFSPWGRHTTHHLTTIYILFMIRHITFCDPSSQNCKCLFLMCVISIFKLKLKLDSYFVGILLFNSIKKSKFFIYFLLAYPFFFSLAIYVSAPTQPILGCHSIGLLYS